MNVLQKIIAVSNFHFLGLRGPILRFNLTNMDTAAEFKRFLTGLCAALDAEAEVVTSLGALGTEAAIHRTGQKTIFVSRERMDLGIVWSISTEVSQKRRHPSAQGAIRSLAALLAPNKPAGRVLFASDRRAET